MGILYFLYSFFRLFTSSFAACVAVSSTERTAIMIFTTFLPDNVYHPFINLYIVRIYIWSGSRYDV